MCPSLCETLPGKRQSQCFGSVHGQNFRQRYKTLQHRAGWKGKHRAPATLANTSLANPIRDSVILARGPRLLGAFEQRSAIAVSSCAGANLVAPWQVGTRRWLVPPRWLSPPWAGKVEVSAPAIVLSASKLTPLPFGNQKASGHLNSYIKHN